LDTLEQIMLGGLDKMSEAACVVVGGHTVRDAEIKFGYSVTGIIDPTRAYTNTGAQTGDDLVLTKAIGTGVITTALKQRRASLDWVRNAVRSMTTLNRKASAIAISTGGVHAMTDVTGFGLMGHGREIALGSGVTLEIEVQNVPLIDGALEAVGLGAIPGGLLANREFAECIVADALGSHIAEELRTLMYDPQTSGGLLICLAPTATANLLASLLSEGLPAAKIGRVVGTYTSGEGNAAIVLR
jgi:selenide,water dikinase